MFPGVVLGVKSLGCTALRDRTQMFVAVTDLPFGAVRRQRQEGLFGLGATVLVYPNHVTSPALTRHLWVNHKRSTFIHRNVRLNCTCRVGLFQLTTNRVLPIIKCDQLSSSNASVPAMTKLARKRLITFCTSRSRSSSQESFLWKREKWKLHVLFVPHKCTVCADVETSWCELCVMDFWKTRSDLLSISRWMCSTLARLIIKYWASFTRDRGEDTAAAKKEKSI